MGKKGNLSDFKCGKVVRVKCTAGLDGGPKNKHFGLIR